MKKILLWAALVLLMVPAMAQTQNDQDKQQIRAVVETFRKSIINKDSVSFNQLFLYDSIPWLGITDDKSMTFVKKYYPDKKALDPSSYKDFIKFIVTTKGKVEEKFFNVKVENDLLIASVTFDYSLWVDDKPQNWGKESWELIKVDGKWKIFFVSYSSYLAQVTPVPANLK
ncbi:hypothetical protein ABID22_002771 [Pontibacter aydingkolensis]|uniref:Nuclear transport factor 2 family protein n=1 Tax=Pontibacter aydingkolensis TaxID=1911536 RepID=A0ABS7CWV7_9BACT|nr:nuclear transport factor 2 family protein [Pontibacter aydingkolensis]MBW7468270.1 nuclear transport factor 2 family protein [Pontibacter aydingkolensis]